MGAHSPYPWVVLFTIAVVLFGARWRRPPEQGRAEQGAQRAFFEGMNLTSGLALGGAMLLALSLLVDVYGPDWELGTAGDDVSLAMAGLGGLLVLLSLVFARPRGNSEP